MDLRKTTRFFYGYCVIKLEGPRRERFINLAMAREIDLWDIVQKGEQKIYCKVNIKDIKKLREIVHISKCPFEIVGKKGLPFYLYKARKRKGATLGLVLFILSLYFLSSFIWFIKIEPQKPMKIYTESQIKQELKRTKVEVGSRKRGIQLDIIEKQLQRRLPDLAFIDMHYVGTLLKVELVEKQLKEQNASNHIAHIIANQDGVIEELLVLNGEPKVKVGDTVQKGQVLISGIILDRAINPTTGQDELTGLEPKYVRARGIIRAKVWYEESIDIPILEKGYKHTGKQVKIVKYKYGNNSIKVKGPKKIPYKYYTVQEKSKSYNPWRIFRSPVEVIETVYFEKVPFKRINNREEAIKLGEKRAQAKLLKSLGQGITILDQKVQLINADEECVTIKIMVEAREDIGEIREFDY
jgi:similar to stage IV sporulation protein